MPLTDLARMFYHAYRRRNGAVKAPEKETGRVTLSPSGNETTALTRTRRERLPPTANGRKLPYRACPSNSVCRARATLRGSECYWSGVEKEGTWRLGVTSNLLRTHPG